MRRWAPPTRYTLRRITASIVKFHTLPSVKNTRAERRVLKYACSVNGKLNQLSTRKKFKHLHDIIICVQVFFTLMRKYAFSVKSAYMMY